MSDDLPTDLLSPDATPAPLPDWLPTQDLSVYPIEIRRDWVLARVMIEGYIKKYASDVDEWEVIGCEVPFTGEVINPETGSNSRTFVMAGIFDKIARRKSDGSLWLWEHKTAASITGGYLEQLWLNNQITLYAIYGGNKYKIPFAGVVYDVLQKSKIEWKEGETEIQFEERKLTMKKPGMAKQAKSDTPQSFGEKIVESFAEKNVLHREVLYFSQEDLTEQAQEIWELTKAMLHARERKFYPKNTSQCFVYNRKCEYFDICASRGNQNVIAALYQPRALHQELRAVGLVDESGHIPGDPREVITNSYLGTFRNCQRLAKYKYQDAISKYGESSRALVFGKVIHAALEIWDTTHDPIAVRKKVDDEFTKPTVTRIYGTAEQNAEQNSESQTQEAGTGASASSAEANAFFDSLGF